MERERKREMEKKKSHVKERGKEQMVKKN